MKWPGRLQSEPQDFPIWIEKDKKTSFFLLKQIHIGSSRADHAKSASMLAKGQTGGCSGEICRVIWQGKEADSERYGLILLCWSVFLGSSIPVVDSAKPIMLGSSAASLLCLLSQLKLGVFQTYHSQSN